MFFIQFEALLKTRDGELLEHGKLRVSQEENSVDFTNEFVPMLTFGTIVNIEVVSAQTLICSFSGKVYLSSRKLLRLTSIDEPVLFLLRDLADSNINARTTMQTASGHLLPFMSKSLGVDSTIYFISPDLVKFTSIVPLEIGQRLSVMLEHPLVLKKFTIEVLRRIQLGARASCYFCAVHAVGRREQQSIDAYLQLTAEPPSLPEEP